MSDLVKRQFQYFVAKKPKHSLERSFSCLTTADNTICSSSILLQKKPKHSLERSFSCLTTADNAILKYHKVSERKSQADKRKGIHEAVWYPNQKDIYIKINDFDHSVTHEGLFTDPGNHTYNFLFVSNC